MLCKSIYSFFTRRALKGKLGIQRALGHLETGALKALKHLGTQGTWAFKGH